jgi:hypothetical protein
MIGTYKNTSDNRTYQVTKVKSTLFMQCLDCQTKNGKNEIKEQELNRLIGHKILLKIN